LFGPVGGAGVSDDGDDDDNGGGGGGGQNTRIEMNPLELMAQLDQQVARNSSPSTPVPPGTQTGTGAAPLPAPPTGPNKTIPAPPKGSKGSSKFLPPQNMPTVVAADAEQADGEGEGETVLKPSPELAPTAMASPVISEAAFKPTAMAMDAQTPPVDVAGPMSSTQYAVRASSMQAAQHGTQPEMAAQGDPSRPSITDYPVMPGGQRPFSTDLAPSSLSSGPQRAPYDPSAAANLMSPVGQSYPQTDWEHAAAQSAKALPPWMLAALFVGALGGALLLTIVLAKIFS
jgi:hypothetical protein